MDQSNSQWCNKSCILPIEHRESPVDLIPRILLLSYRKEIPAKRIESVAATCCQLRNVNRTPFLPLLGSGSTNSGTVYVAQKPYSSSAPRMLTWINATSIRICNRHSSSATHMTPSQKCPHPPTPSSSEEVSSIGDTICAIHFRGPSIRQGSFNTLISGYLLLGAPTCCLNTWTLLMVSVMVYLGTLS